MLLVYNLSSRFRHHVLFGLQNNVSSTLALDSIFFLGLQKDATGLLTLDLHFKRRRHRFTLGDDEVPATPKKNTETKTTKVRYRTLWMQMKQQQFD